jgi:hypothetical protein
MGFEITEGFFKQPGPMMPAATGDDCPGRHLKQCGKQQVKINSISQVSKHYGNSQIGA